MFTTPLYRDRRPLVSCSGEPPLADRARSGPPRDPIAPPSPVLCPGPYATLVHGIIVIFCYGSNMCYNGKCMHCLEIETGSLIFAIFSIIGTSVGMLYTICALVYLNVMMTAITYNEGDEEIMMGFVSILMANTVLGAILCFLAVPFAFTIVLIKGLAQKNATYVKVYFVYAVVTKCIALVSLALAAISGGVAPLPALIALLACGFHALILRMIYLTYKKFQVNVQYDKHELVGEKY